MGTRVGRISGWKYRKLRVIDGRLGRHYPRFGNRDDEVAAPFAISRLLAHYLSSEIPNEQQNVIRLVRDLAIN